MVKKARAAGSFLGGIFNNPGIVILGLALGGLLIFRDKISEAFASIPGAVASGIGDINIQLPSFEFPKIELPEFKFPEIEFPELPDFAGLFSGFQEQLDTLGKQFQDFKLPELPPLFVEDPSVSTVPDPLDQNLSPGLAGGIQQRQRDLRESLAEQGVTPAQQFAAEKGGASGILQIIEFLGLTFATPAQIAAAEVTPPLPPDTPAGDFGTTVIQSLGTEQEFIGGGVGFQGGSVSPTPITTFSQVLDLFPGITASQAANFLSEFSGILPEAALLQGFEVPSLSSAPGDPPQMFDQSSVGTTGISPQELFKLLFPTIISNF